MIGLAKLHQLQLKRGHLFVMALSAVTLIVIMLEIAYLHRSIDSSPAVMDQKAALKAAHMGTIVVRRDSSRCEQRSFDNDNGSIDDKLLPCDSEVVHDANGRPLLQGVDPRLNAISKSFSGR